MTEATYAGTFVRVILRHRHQRLEAHIPLGTMVAVGEDAGLRLPADRLWRLPADGERPVSTGS